MRDLAINFFKETLEDLKSFKGSIARKLPQQKSGLSNNTTLNEHLPPMCLNPDTHMFENKKTYSFILKVAPFSGIDEKTINGLTKIISYEVPDNAYIQVINYASPQIKHLTDRWQESCRLNGIFKSLSKKRTNFYLSNNSRNNAANDIAFRDFEIYLIISFDKPVHSLVNQEFINSIIDMRSRLSQALKNIGCVSQNVGTADLNKYLSEMLSPGKQEYVSSDVSGRNAVQFASDTEYLMFPTCVKVKESSAAHKYLIFEVESFPNNWSVYKSIDYTGFFSQGRTIPYPFYISFGFKVTNHKESERHATKMRLIRTNQTTSKLVNFMPAMKEEMDDWFYTCDEIDKGERLTQAIMHVIAIIDESTDETQATQIILDHFYQLGFKLNQIKYDCLNSLIYTLPMNLAEHWQLLKKNKALTTLLTSNCLNLLSIFADSQNSVTPLMIFIGRRGQVFFFDNYASIENGNYNMVVVGKSGSGKSVFLQEYMTCILRQDGQVVVIDDGRSFQNSCKILAGDFVDFENTDLCINPFSLYKEQAKQDESFKVEFEEPLIDLIVSILCIVTNIDKNNTKNFNIGLYRDVLKKAVQIVLKQKGSRGGFKNVYEVLRSNKELRSEQTEDIADKLSFVLREYANGRYQHYYNGKASLAIENLLTIFELSNLESNEVLQTSVLLMVVFLVYIKMQKRERRTSLIIDEAWRLLRHDAIKGFIEGIARRARKYNGSLVVATQSISDFEETKSQAAAAVLSQSDWRVLLSAESKDAKILKEQLGMEQGEVEIAKNLKGDKGRFSEFMIRHSSNSWLIGRLVLDEFSSKLYSSKAEDVIKIKEQIRKGLSLDQAIENLIKVVQDEFV